MKRDPEKLQSETWLIALILTAMVASLGAGCSRQTYRKWADRDAYRLLKSREFDQQWTLPDRTVEPNPTSRLADVYDPDCPPLPPDDPAAKRYMRQPYHSKMPVAYWYQRGEADAIDSQQWINYLPFNKSGEVVLDKQLTVDLALLNNREFQTRVEQLYSTALALSANRFEYDLNWFGGTSTSFDASTASQAFQTNRDLMQSNRLGFTRNLATGGQYAVSLLNSFTWQFGGVGSSNFSAGNLVFNLTQPLLRGAFRHVRTESLTQAERNLLYAVRDFAHFRREFYLQQVSQFLNILTQAQRVRIDEDNLRSLDLNLEEYDVLQQNETVSQIEVDQVFQDYQSGRLDLIGSQQDLQTRLDALRLGMGLPARIPIKLDEAILKPFELNSPEVERLRDEAESLEQEIMQFLPPDAASQEFLDQVKSKLKSFASDVELLKPKVDAEFEQWSELLKSNAPGEDASKAEQSDYDQESKLAVQIKMFLDELDDQIAAAKKEAASGSSGDSTNPSDSILKNDAAGNQEPSADDDQIGFEPNDTAEVKQWRRIQYRIARLGGLKDRISTLFVVQTQIRLFLIQIKPIDLGEQAAVEIALERRLDLMNSRAAVVDAYRTVEIAADQLQSDLDVTASANIGTDPNSNNVLRFDSEANRYNVGLEFDSPLNRFNERNSYRNAQLAYQQERRNYMAAEDSIVNGIRLDIRELRTTRFNFQIARQSLITATRQVDETQFTLREGEGNSSSTQNLLLALRTLRAAKNSLISSWIQYEVSRIELFVDLELLMLDNNGIWINDRENFDEYITSGRPGFEDPSLTSIDADSGSDRRLSEPAEPNTQPQRAVPTESAPTDPAAALDVPLADVDDAPGGGWLRGLLGRN